MKFNFEYLMVIGSVFGTEGDAVSNSLPSVRPLNFRGRCAFGMPCDHRRISYGCEKNIGVCWSECVGTLEKTFGTGHFQYEGWCYNVNRDIGAMIDQMFDGKSSKEGKSFHYRGRRARPSADEAEAMRAAAREESLDYVDYNSTISDYDEDEMFMGKPRDEFAQCETDDDCADIARHCGIGCGNMVEAQVGH